MAPGDEEFFNEGNDSKTAFNSALDIIQRISRFEYSLAAALLKDDPANIVDAFKLLRLIYSEIDFKLTEADIKEIDKYIEALKGRMVKALHTYNNEGRVYISNPDLREEFKEDLFELKRVLGKLKYKSGLGMIDQSDPRFALLNG